LTHWGEGDLDELIISQIEGLTSRQREILRLIARHKRGKEIARELNITERTVKAHTVEARKRLNVTSSRDAALLVLEYDIKNGPVPEGQWRSRTVTPAGRLVPFSDHEYRPPTTDAPDTTTGGLHDLPLDGTPAGLGIHSSSKPTGGREGNGRGHSSSVSQPLGPSNSDPASIRNLLVDGSREFRSRLKALSLPGWIGLILILAVLSALVVGAFLYLSLGVLEGMEHLYRQAT
jgi:DNA-binding CsgD family transcriptional regulator